MNIAQAKQIRLQQLVEKFGGRFSHKGSNHHELWFYSPFRPEEKTASFKVDEKTNSWHDFARTEKVDAHGDILDLWTDYHNLPRRSSDALKQALTALREGFNHVPSVSHAQKHHQRKPIEKTPRYKIKKTGIIWADNLKAEIAHRNLSLALVRPYLKQAWIQDKKTGRTYNGFAFPNDKGGYEISIPNPATHESFKSVIGAKAMTTLRNPEHRDVCVFEGFWDYLSWLALNKDPKTKPTFYVLNSVSMIGELAKKLIENKHSIASVFLFLDNDDAGEKATNTLLDILEPHNIKAGTMNHLYHGYKDLSEFKCRCLK